VIGHAFVFYGQKYEVCEKKKIEKETNQILLAHVLGLAVAILLQILHEELPTLGKSLQQI